jgi:phage shock protein A
MSRTSLVAKAKYSKLLDRAENPVETLDYSCEQQLVQLQNVKRGIADVATAKKRLELQDASTQQQLGHLDAQAKQALQAGREDLARQALQRKAALQGQVASLQEQEQSWRRRSRSWSKPSRRCRRRWRPSAPRRK